MVDIHLLNSAITTIDRPGTCRFSLSKDRRAPLLPKFHGYFTEFLRYGSLKSQHTLAASYTLFVASECKWITSKTLQFYSHIGGNSHLQLVEPAPALSYRWFFYWTYISFVFAYAYQLLKCHDLQVRLT
jgi:hypothetical protein